VLRFTVDVGCGGNSIISPLMVSCSMTTVPVAVETATTAKPSGAASMNR
jgi:hypothetical protein